MLKNCIKGERKKNEENNVKSGKEIRKQKEKERTHERVKKEMETILKENIFCCEVNFKNSEEIKISYFLKLILISIRNVEAERTRHIKEERNGWDIRGAIQLLA